MAFSDGIIFLSLVFSRSISVAAHASISFLTAKSSPLYKYSILFLFVSWWFGEFCPLGFILTMLLYPMSMFSYSLSTYLGVEFPDYTIVLCLIIGRRIRAFHRVYLFMSPEQHLRAPVHHACATRFNFHNSRSRTCDILFCLTSLNRLPDTFSPTLPCLSPSHISL